MASGIRYTFGLFGLLLAILYLWLGWPHQWWEIVTLSVLVLCSITLAIGAVLRGGRERYFTSALAGGLQITSSPLPTRPSRLYVAATLWARDHGRSYNPSSPAKTDAPPWEDVLRPLREAASYKAASPILSTWVKVFDAQGRLLIELPVGRTPHANDTVILEFGTSTSDLPIMPSLVLGTAARVVHNDLDNISIWLTADSVIHALGPEVELDE